MITNHHALQTSIDTSSLDFDDTISLGPPFVKIPRISYLDSQQVSNSILDFVVKQGLPLAIEGWSNHPNWDQNLFSLDNLKNLGQDLGNMNA